MSGADDVFNAFKEPGLAREAQARGQQDSFEERVIKQLLRYAKINFNAKNLQQRSWEDTQSTGISFGWFNENYPRFPIYLGSAKLKNTSGTHIPWTQLFGSGFMKLPWMQEYMKLCHQMGWDVQRDRIGLCFNAPHAPGASTMVLHNQPIQVDNAPRVVDPERREETETRVLRPFGNPRVVYVLESLTSFMATVGSDWAME